MKNTALLSGGKDSVYAIYIAKQYGWNVTNLMTMLPKNTESWMFHSININITSLISEAIDIPLIKRKTKGKKGRELNDLKETLEKLQVDGVISGAIASEYQRTQIEKICHELKIKSFTPLWHKKQDLILKEQIKADFEIIIVGVFAHGLDKSWLGRRIDNDNLDKLIALKKKYNINVAGEGGEFETLVLDGPIFKKKISIDETKTKWKRDHGTLEVKKAKLVDK